MASAFEDEKHTGERSAVFDDLFQKHKISTAPMEQPKGGVAQTGGGVFQTVDDAMRAAADSLSFGMLDRGLEATGLEPGAIQRTAAARERSPYASIAGDVAGTGLAVAATPLRALGSGLSAAWGGAKAGLPGIFGRAAGYGVEGATIGAGQSAGHTYDLKDLPKNVGTGAAFGGLGGAITGPLVPRSAVAPRPAAAVPTNQELGALKDAGYKTVQQNPHDVAFSGGAVRAEAERAKQELYNRTIHEGSAPETFRGLNMPAAAERRAATAGGQATFEPAQLDAIRQQIGQASSPRDIVAASAAKQILDDFAANPSFGTLSRGTPAGAKAINEILQEARGNAAAKFRSDLIRETDEAIRLRSAATNSGRNYENNMRSAIARAISHGEGQSFNAGEQELLKKLATRSDLWNKTREVGNMLGGGGGIGTWVAPAIGGAALGGTSYGFGGDPASTALATAAPILAGRALRSAGNRSMQKAVNEMDDIIRMRSPEFAARQAANPGTIAGPGLGKVGQTGMASRNAIVEELLRQDREKDRPKVTVYPNMR